MNSGPNWTLSRPEPPTWERQLRASQVAVETEETEQRAAAAAAGSPADRGEDRELTELRSRCGMGGYLQAAVEQRGADGAHAEYNAARGIAGNRFPLEMLAPEARATTNTDTQTVPRRWLDRIFAETAAMRIGVTMESVPVGAASFPRHDCGRECCAARPRRSCGRYRVDGRRDGTQADAERGHAEIQH